MTPQICPNFFWLEGIWIDRRIPYFQVPIPNRFFSRHLEKSHFWREIIIIKKLGFKISQCTHDCQASFCIDVNLQRKEKKFMKI